MSKFINFTALLTSLLFLAGCLLPVPHRRLHTHGLIARVVDEKTGIPVRQALVSNPERSRVLSVSDSNGHFIIPRQYGWHAAYCISPISYSLFPKFDFASACPPFRIDASGYHSKTIQPIKPVVTKEDMNQVIILLRPE